MKKKSVTRFPKIFSAWNQSLTGFPGLQLQNRMLTWNLEDVMATENQFNANRQNAQHSTGPRTEEGKDTSRFNALKHGADAKSRIIPGEDPAEREALSNALAEQYQPQNVDEAFKVDTLSELIWNIQRLERFESKMLAIVAADNPNDPDGHIAKILIENGPAARALNRAFSKLLSLRRLYSKTEKELRDAQARRAEAAATGNRVRSENRPPAPAPSAETPAPDVNSSPKTATPGPEPPK